MVLRIVHAQFPPKGSKSTDRSSLATKEGLLPVYVAEQNQIAAQYLLQILAEDRALRAACLEDLIVHKPTKQMAPVFVLDRGGIDLPLGECLHVLRGRFPEAKFVVLDMEHPPEELVQLLALGIHGFVAYPGLGEQLTQAVNCVAQGKMWISASVLEAYARHSIASLKSVNESPNGQGITERESQVIELVKRRLSNKEVGRILNVKESTVKFHLSNIFSKLQVSRRSELQDKGELNEIWRQLIAS